MLLIAINIQNKTRPTPPANIECKISIIDIIGNKYPEQNPPNPSATAEYKT
jgi:hypothetical protein